MDVVTCTRIRNGDQPTIADQGLGRNHGTVEAVDSSSTTASRSSEKQMPRSIRGQHVSIQSIHRRPSIGFA